MHSWQHKQMELVKYTMHSSHHKLMELVKYTMHSWQHILMELVKYTMHSWQHKLMELVKYTMHSSQHKLMELVKYTMHSWQYITNVPEILHVKCASNFQICDDVTCTIGMTCTITIPNKNASSSVHDAPNFTATSLRVQRLIHTFYHYTFPWVQRVRSWAHFKTRHDDVTEGQQP